MRSAECGARNESVVEVDPPSPPRFRSSFIIHHSAFSLVELLIVISLMGILAGLVLPDVRSGLHDQLKAAAQIVAADLNYGRSLAVTNDSKYRFTFDLSRNRYVLEHSGTTRALDALPSSPFRSPSDPVNQHVVDLNDLPRIGAPVNLLEVQALGSPRSRETTLEFGPLGETTRAAETVIWLTAGTGSARRYMPVHVNPVTGLVATGDYQGAPPPTVP